jgi:hypothetical protein
MLSIGTTLLRIGTGVALLAILPYAFLPAGMVLKRAGPCGKALCTCPPDKARTFDLPVGPTCSHCKSAPSTLRLISVDVSQSALPAAAVRFVLLDLLLVACDTLDFAATPTPEQDWLSSRTWAVSSPSYDVPHPPPRA